MRTIIRRKPQQGDVVRSIATGTHYRITEVYRDGITNHIAFYEVRSLATGLVNTFTRDEIETLSHRAARAAVAEAEQQS